MHVEASCTLFPAAAIDHHPNLNVLHILQRTRYYLVQLVCLAGLVVSCAVLPPFSGS
jgi:hypothetical protein